MGFDGLFWLPLLTGLCAVFALVLGVGLVLRRSWAQRELEEWRQVHAESVDVDPQSRTGRSLLAGSWSDFFRLSKADTSPSGGHGDGSGSDGVGGGD